MSRFKDAIAKDIKAVFINGLEFADLHDINGCEMLAVVDGDIIQERSGQRKSDYDGVFEHQIMVFVAAEDMKNRPVKGERFWLDGELYIVADCGENMGVLEITIEANVT